MRLVRYLADGEVYLGVKSGDEIISLSDPNRGIPNDMLELISSWGVLQGSVSDAIQGLSLIHI